MDDEVMHHVNDSHHKQQITIPKIVMQIWFTSDGRSIPDHWKSSPISIKKYLPDWDYIVLSSEDGDQLCKEHFPWFWDTYNNFPYFIQRVDAAKVMWLYVHGGLYMDFDYEIIDDRFQYLFTSNTDLYFAPSANISSYLTNSIMASKPKNKFWIIVLEHMMDNLPWYRRMGKHLTVMNSTGPMMLTNCIKKYNEPYTIIPSKLVTPCNVCDLNCGLDEAYVKPLNGSSWVGNDTKIYQYCMCNAQYWWVPLIIIIGIILLLFIAWWGYYYFI